MFLSDLFDRTSAEADNHAGDGKGRFGAHNQAQGHFYQGRNDGGVYVEESLPMMGLPAWEAHLAWVKQEWMSGRWHWEYRWPLNGIVPAFKVFDGFVDGRDDVEVDEKGMLELSGAVSLIAL